MTYDFALPFVTVLVLSTGIGYAMRMLRRHSG
jgi:hypothetical protein